MPSNMGCRIEVLYWVCCLRAWVGDLWRPIAGKFEWDIMFWMSKKSKYEIRLWLACIPVAWFRIWFVEYKYYALVDLLKLRTNCHWYVNRDAYGFAVRPQHLQRYREYANIYKVFFFSCSKKLFLFSFWSWHVLYVCGENLWEGNKIEEF